MNDAGDARWFLRQGETVDEAVAKAENDIRELTGDDSWVMNDWRAV